MLRRKDTFTVITPIPGFIPRQLAIDILHSHSEVITLNPLVLDHRPIAAPQNAETDEYYSTWYEITERITFMPGIGKMGASIIKFNGCFHDMPWGLQTHIYAPMNVDLRNKYRIAGNQPGIEPPEIPEIGAKASGIPADGLYLREDIEIKCNLTVLSFVKAQLKKAGGEMVQRIIKKAELLDAGVLQAMLQDGKLKTVNPADRRNTIRSNLPSPIGIYHSGTASAPGTPPPLHSPQLPYQIPRPQSVTQSYRPGTAGSHAGSHPGSPGPSGHSAVPAAFGYGTPGGPMELPASEPAHNNHFAVEMPGDFYHAPAQHQPPQPSQPSPKATPSYPVNRDSTVSAMSQGSPDPSQNGQWTTRPISLASNASGFQSPGLDKNFSSGLAPHKETTEEHREEALKQLDPRAQHQQPPSHSPYNPADYAKVGVAYKQAKAQTKPHSPPATQTQYGQGQLAQRYTNYTQ
ncbi:hypothetical protein B0T19DRAFT_215569 [Cercophora scortea]|uniref:DUF7053 domain-containing protein n=1 Tax=Cercophora scortea TaxID=314031 RepID=A0AAE0M8Y9_9PEZI|nr:hypothetical protein B0T19DRAFT_215569 [Cercophora scortea]